jgi:hypothetical protein
MIICEYANDILAPHCKKGAEYVINWGNKPHIFSIPFNDQNFVCGEHLRKIRKAMEKEKLEVYRLDKVGGKEKVEFT